MCLLMHTSIDRSRMKQIYAAIILIAALFVAMPAMAAAMAPRISWQELSPQQQQILAPLANDWSSLSEKQQKNFIGIAKRYPELTPLKQQRLQERLLKWSKLTPAQRRKAREKYQSFNELPPEKREAEKQTLREQHAKKHPLAASAVQPAAPAP
jgi:hypothetical protein